jgi:hypothetical protein
VGAALLPGIDFVPDDRTSTVAPIALERAPSKEQDTSFIVHLNDKETVTQLTAIVKRAAFNWVYAGIQRPLANAPGG